MHDCACTHFNINIESNNNNMVANFTWDILFQLQY